MLRDRLGFKGIWETKLSLESASLSLFCTPLSCKSFAELEVFDVNWFTLYFILVLYLGLGKGGDCGGKEVVAIAVLKQHHGCEQGASSARCCVCVRAEAARTGISEGLPQLMVLAGRRSSSVVLGHGRPSLGTWCGITAPSIAGTAAASWQDTEMWVPSQAWNSTSHLDKLAVSWTWFEALQCSLARRHPSVPC